MTRLLCVIILSIGFAALASDKAFAATPNLSQEEFAQHVAKARRFVCSRLNTNPVATDQTPDCIAPQIHTERGDDTHGFLAYFHRAERRISLLSGLDSIATQLNLVHELTHAYRDQFNHEEETWLDEGLAKFMEYRYSTVWPVSYQDKLRKNPDLRLTNNEQAYLRNGDGYTSSFFFVLYLYNHFGGNEFLQKLAHSKMSGWDNILTAIKELKAEGRLGIDDSLISKPSILRHFALALWFNDPFAAKYALFSLDSQYEPLAAATIRSAANVDSTQLDTQAGEARIAFSKKLESTNASEVYAVISRTPLVIEPAKPGQHAQVFVYIFY